MSNCFIDNGQFFQTNRGPCLLSKNSRWTTNDKFFISNYNGYLVNT
jgi:hypothetical protein